MRYDSKASNEAAVRKSKQQWLQSSVTTIAAKQELTTLGLLVLFSGVPHKTMPLHIKRWVVNS